MQLVEFKNSDIIFNWHILPKPLDLNLELRDKIFKELQEKYKNELIDSKTLFEMNDYVIKRINSSDVIHDRTSNKNS